MVQDALVHKINDRFSSTSNNIKNLYDVDVDIMLYTETMIVSDVPFRKIYFVTNKQYLDNYDIPFLYHELGHILGEHSNCNSVSERITKEIHAWILGYTVSICLGDNDIYTHDVLLNAIQRCFMMYVIINDYMNFNDISNEKMIRMLKNSNLQEDDGFIDEWIDNLSSDAIEDILIKGDTMLSKFLEMMSINYNTQMISIDDISFLDTIYEIN